MTHSNPVLIPLYKHEQLFGYAIVDPEDAPRLLVSRWSMSSQGYAVSTQKDLFDGENLMHRIIAKPQKGQVVDHINHMRSDNRKANLRGCTHAENMRNTRRNWSQTGLRGVFLDKRYGMYAVSIVAEGKKYSLGRYETKEDAAKIYDAAARQLHGEFAVLNFPDFHLEGFDFHAYAEHKRNNPAGKRITDEQAAVIRSRSDERADTLAMEYNVSPALIHNIRAGRSHLPKVIPPDMLTLALERVEKGEAHTAVASGLKISRAALLRAIHAKWGRLTPATARRRRSNAKLSTEQVHEILRRVEAGEKQKDLAAEFGVKIATVNGYVRGRKKVQALPGGVK